MDDDVIEQRFELHEERLDHYRDRIGALEEADQSRAESTAQKRSHTLEWIVIALVALEAVFEILMYFHPHA
jgi:uncharacterized Rmd1/YagE family protein